MGSAEYEMRRQYYIFKVNLPRWHEQNYKKSRSVSGHRI